MGQAASIRRTIIRRSCDCGSLLRHRMASGEKPRDRLHAGLCDCVLCWQSWAKRLQFAGSRSAGFEFLLRTLQEPIIRRRTLHRLSFADERGQRIGWRQRIERGEDLWLIAVNRPTSGVTGPPPTTLPFSLTLSAAPVHVIVGRLLECRLSPWGRQASIAWALVHHAPSFQIVETPSTTPFSIGSRRFCHQPVR